VIFQKKPLMENGYVSDSKFEVDKCTYQYLQGCSLALTLLTLTDGQCPKIAIINASLIQY